MCTVLVAWSWRVGEPDVLAANRDELLTRPSDTPLRLHDRPALYGGRDKLAGGTWLAVDPGAGRLCAVTNRHLRESDPGRDPALRSRGELPLRILTAADPAGELSRLAPGDYNPVNVVYVARDAAWWASLDRAEGGQAVRHVAELAPGVHALTVQDVDDPRSRKTVRLLAAARAAADAAADATALRDALTGLLASHETDGDDPASAACIHGDVYGTVSSSTVALGSEGAEMRFADGRPCVTPYRPVQLS